jgi:hypothetical protein
MVVRRLGVGSSSESAKQKHTAADPYRVEGWREQKGRVRAWLPFLGSAEANLDPDPSRRPTPLRSGNAEIDRVLAQRLVTPETLGEAWAPLFVVPPEVIAATGRTLLYGVVPVTSDEQTAVEGPAAYSVEDVKLITPNLLYATGRLGNALGHRSETLTANHLTLYQDDAEFQAFLSVVRQLAFQYGAFDDTPEGQAVFAQLDRLLLPLPGGAQIGAATLLRMAADLFVFRRPGASPFVMPTLWPGFTPSHSAEMLGALKAVLDSRLGNLRQQTSRFDGLDRQYLLRVFVRQRRDCVHPPDWSGYTEPFRIAPWYESSGRPPVRIQLPAVDSDFLRKLKPNVAFALPPKTFNLLQNLSPKKLMEGEEQSDAGLDIMWICQFNLVIIFVLAFMVMFVFLLVFDIVFRWLLYVKICIPIPKKA